ncbi:ABC transporter ATP-binding protein [Helicobacter sp. 11S03491-1]|uniref:ABC transporter ATP-binding protein n=1 Tax=Helicobacter sp. 11S03491-1 TaxID=1476196 RepID=UPI000BA7D1AF|nr:ABC transporter ATP-binding protein [Helicobacter sp. 11S03491-1]PAF42057.1 hypothetical protein BKH45_05615 [Helicobacter sp. 11S03491-1]
MNILEIKDLSFNYGKNHILEDIYLCSKQGSISAILAPNGTGKTTLFHNILGILKPLKGSIRVKDENILGLGAAGRAHYISYVPQEWQSPFNYNVLDIIIMGQTHKMGLFGMPTINDKNKALELMEEMNIAHLQNHGINQLSGGQRQMVLLARALFQECPVLLLDEPTSHLDIKNQTLLFHHLKNQVRKKSLSVLINIHDPNLVSAYADEVYMIKNGKNFCNGHVNEVMNAQNLSQLYEVGIEIGYIHNRPFIHAY